ncbi:unnamed protein product, partial [Brachionus calyciflorus]
IGRVHLMYLKSSSSLFSASSSESTSSSVSSPLDSSDPF